MNHPQSADLPWYGWVGIGLLLLGQGTWLFLDARRRGARPWLWGLWGVINFPLPSVMYWFFVVRRPRGL
jgi:hypothetical protein